MEKTLKPARTKRPKQGNGQDMAVIIRDTPPSFDWGWFSREDPRMHLQAVDKRHRPLHYKVWLERAGRRVIEPEPGIPAKVFKTLRTAIIKERMRLDIEWAIFMIKNGWLQAKLVGSSIVLTAYPKTPNQFVRTIPVSELIGNEAFASKLTPKDVALNAEFGFLELYPQLDEARRIHDPLERILWAD